MGLQGLSFKTKGLGGTSRLLRCACIFSALPFEMKKKDGTGENNGILGSLIHATGVGWHLELSHFQHSTKKYTECVLGLVCPAMERFQSSARQTPLIAVSDCKKDLPYNC